MSPKSVMEIWCYVLISSVLSHLGAGFQQGRMIRLITPRACVFLDILCEVVPMNLNITKEQQRASEGRKKQENQMDVTQQSVVVVCLPASVLYQKVTISSAKSSYIISDILY